MITVVLLLGFTLIGLSLLQLIPGKALSQLEQVGIAYGLGIGISTLLLFVLGIIGVPIRLETIVVALVALLILPLLYRFVDKERALSSGAQVTATWGPEAGSLLPLLVVCGVFGLAFAYPWYTQDSILYYWGKGTEIARTGAISLLALRHYYQDTYPLLLPILHAVIELIGGSHEAIMYWGFYAGLVVVSVQAFAYAPLRVPSRPQRHVLVVSFLLATMLGLLLATAPLFIYLATAISSNPPSVYYFFVAAFLFYRVISEDQFSLLPLCGLFFGLSVWARVEMAFFIAIPSLLIGVYLLHARVDRKHMTAFFLPMLISASLWPIWRTMHWPQVSDTYFDQWEFSEPLTRMQRAAPHLDTVALSLLWILFVILYLFRAPLQRLLTRLYQALQRHFVIQLPSWQNKKLATVPRLIWPIGFVLIVLILVLFSQPLRQSVLGTVQMMTMRHSLPQFRDVWGYAWYISLIGFLSPSLWHGRRAYLSTFIVLFLVLRLLLFTVAAQGELNLNTASPLGSYNRNLLMLLPLVLLWVAESRELHRILASLAGQVSQTGSARLLMGIFAFAFVVMIGGAAVVNVRTTTLDPRIAKFLDQPQIYTREESISEYFGNTARFLFFARAHLPDDATVILPPKEPDDATYPFYNLADVHVRVLLSPLDVRLESYDYVTSALLNPEAAHWTEQAAEHTFIIGGSQECREYRLFISESIWGFIGCASQASEKRSHEK